MQDITIWCEDGGLVKTSSVLLAAISPWIRSLLEDMGGKEVGLMDSISESTHVNLYPKGSDGLIIPSISSSDFNLYIDSCLNMAPLSANNKEQVLGVHSFLVPDTWHTEVGRERVKVEVDLPGHHVKHTSGQIADAIDQAMDEDEDDHHVDPLLDMKPDAKDSSKPKLEPYRCRYDSTCTVAFRSVKVIHFIICNPLCNMQYSICNTQYAMIQPVLLPSALSR